ncbi:MAG: diphthine--ammonia ligase [Candidatus Omnitrophota bacterium]|nr:diphthine--ammonia ligase [Candidatus Omnitrophota bacterium]
MNNLAIASWSGGKDSCLALFRAIKSGIKIKYLLNFISREYKRCCFHGIESKLIDLQAQCLGISLVQKEVTPDMKKYEEEFKEAVTELKGKNINKMVFGDIYLLDQMNWVERVCADLGITPIEPLWNNPASNLVREFIDSGFKSIIVSAKADVSGENFIGRVIDEKLVRELEERKICPCGENGEFHSFVIDGPIFKNRIEILESKPILKGGFWKHWFLDIKKYRVVEKIQTGERDS